MMKYTIEVIDYDDGIKLTYEPDATISATHSAYGETVIQANRNGLITLAKMLLTLAQDGVPSGSHIHLDEYNFLEDGSSELILVRRENWENNQEKYKNNA